MDLIDPPDPGEADAAAIRAVLDGDPAAYAGIVERHHEALRRVLLGVLGDAHLAEDVAQEVWWIVYRRLETFAFRSRFRTWLHRVAIREALTARNRVRRRLALHARLADVAEPASAAPSADATLASAEQARRLLARLPAGERAAFVLHVEGLAYAEIAAALGCPEGTVAVRIHRARARLARALGSRTGDAAR